MIKINQVILEEATIRYDYTVSPEYQRYFSTTPYFVRYDRSVEEVPISIAVIPLLANLMPLAWFLGCNVEVDEVDATFCDSLINLKQEFAVHFPKISPTSQLIVGKTVKNTIPGDETALLFSGGLDAFESLTRNLQINPYLVSVFGADIPLTQTHRWDDFRRFNREEEIVDDTRLCYVTSNLQTFYTYHVDLLVDVGWWGKIQHGMALISLVAPLSFMKGIRTVMIASSNTGEVSFGWGSTSETDEKVKWADSRVIHDGFHLRRTQKIENIVAFGKRTGHKIKLRVCYSDYRKGYNCSECPKCLRTMFGLVLEGVDPGDYGFKLPANFLSLVLRNFGDNALMTTGVAYEWKCLQEKARTATDIFPMAVPEQQERALTRFISFDIDAISARNAEKKVAQRRLKHVIINKFPKLFGAYLWLRRKL